MYFLKILLLRRRKCTTELSPRDTPDTGVIFATDTECSHAPGATKYAALVAFCLHGAMVAERSCAYRAIEKLLATRAIGVIAALVKRSGK